MDSRKTFGQCSVDSGQLFIVDPCYLSSWEHGGFVAYGGPEANQDNSYARVSSVTTEGDGAGEAELGVAFGTQIGDGVYDVVGVYEDGRLVRVEIIIQPEHDEDDLCSMCGEDKLDCECGCEQDCYCGKPMSECDCE